MFFKYLLYLTKEFPKFLFFRIPEHLVYFYKNSFSELEKRLQVRLNLGMFFVPLWGARDWALRFVSLLYRLFRIVFGSFILLVYTLLLASFAFLLFLSLPYFLFKSFPVFLALLLLYFVSYIGYFVLNPFKQLIFNEKDKTFEDLYSSSLLKARKFLESIQDNRDIDSYFSDIANYLELDYKELEKFISNVKDKEKEIVTRTLRLGTDLKYRYLSSDLLACAILYVQEDFIKYLDLKNLPADSLDVFLKIQYSKIPKNSPNLWDNDFVSNYVYPYDLSKQDKSTPILNKYANSLDVSKKSLEVYYVEPFIRYRNELIHNLDVGSKKVLIVGNAGVGKTSLVKTLYLDIKLGKVPKSLLYNRIVSLDLSSIVSLGLEGPKLLSAILQEFTSLKNTILFLDNLHVLYSVSGMDYLSILLPYFENPKLKIIVSADYSTYINLLKKDTGITNNFRVIKVEELEGKDLLDFLVLKTPHLRKPLTIPAILFLNKYTSQVLFEKNNPKKSLAIIEKALEISKQDFLVGRNKISLAIKELTGVSLGDISAQESSNLLELSKILKKEVVGQDKAVEEVANALIRSRGLRNSGSFKNKPIATFLFAGPTGVGKTELAKALARNYFKGEENIIRLDMSEYQTPESINRLIGSEDGRKPGILIERVKETPFNLLLLDEIEKAHKSIHMLFLQVFDDGRLTDSSGNTISFKNIIIIATTNAGTGFVVNDFTKGLSYEEVRTHFFEKVKEHFPPEFLNRFTEIILFKPLNRDVFAKVLDIKFNKIRESFYNSHKIKLSLDSSLRDFLVSSSYSKEWGARSLERILEKSIDTALSKALLQGSIKPGDSLVLTREFLSQYGL